jgi:hypothetical protein
VTAPLLVVDWAERRRLAVPGGPWAGLADGLRAELEPFRHRDLPIPARKARLTRVGGRCPRDGALLAFDPWAPERHPCPRCDFVGTRPEDHDWWAMGAQLWTVERAVHAAALARLRDEPALADLAWRILRGLADRYAEWPNEDNVLGPSRPFFSTYLEAIWLLHACHALALLEADGATPAGDRVRAQLVAPSAELVASFDEGRSNRQVWNEVALLAAWRVLGEHERVAARLATRGVVPLLLDGLLPDGSWYEGENYHLFAHRGLWHGVQLLRAAGAELPPAAFARYREGFATPFAGLLPDDTLPSRRDTPYAVSVRQWRFAEWCELGLAETARTGRADTRLAGLLARLYGGRDRADVDAGGPLARSRSTADAERNGPPERLARAVLSWRALLCGLERLPAAERWAPASVCLPSQGLAVLRRNAGRTYVALDGGHTGGGHGHPDQLALTLQQDAARWLEDPGTGSYVERALHWYRSTLAHHAPLLGDASQPRMPAALVAYEERGGAGWVVKRLDGLPGGATVTRSVVVCDGYLVDLLEWEGAAGQPLMLAIAGEATAVERTDGAVAPTAWTRIALPGAGGLEDGFDFLDDVQSAPMPGTLVLDVPAHSAASPTAPAPGSPGAAATGDGTSESPAGRKARCWVAASGPADIVRARVPGPPERSPRTRHWVRSAQPAGRLVTVWSWPAPDGPDQAVAEVRLDAAAPPHAVVTTRCGTRAAHAPAPHGWHIALEVRGATSSIDLDGRVIVEGAATPPTPATEPAAPVAPAAPACTPLPSLSPDCLRQPPGTEVQGALRITLGAEAYRPTERPWADAGAPTAHLALAVVDDLLLVDVRADTGTVVVPPPDAENALDNERPEVNADGLQWYLATRPGAPWRAAGIVLPQDAPGEEPGVPRQVRLVRGGAAPACRWRTTPTGWAARLAVPLADIAGPDGVFALELVVNERPPHRERRRGQLVLSGGRGSAFLRGDREASDHALAFRRPSAPRPSPAGARR